MSDNKQMMEAAAKEFTKLLGTECVVHPVPPSYWIDIEKIDCSIWYDAGLWIVGGTCGDPYYGRAGIAGLARELLSDPLFPELHEKA